MEKKQIEEIVQKYRGLANTDKNNACQYNGFADYIEKNAKVFEASCYESENDLWDYYNAFN